MYNLSDQSVFLKHTLSSLLTALPMFISIDNEVGIWSSTANPNCFSIHWIVFADANAYTSLPLCFDVACLLITWLTRLLPIPCRLYFGTTYTIDSCHILGLDCNSTSSFLSLCFIRSDAAWDASLYSLVHGKDANPLGNSVSSSSNSCHISSSISSSIESLVCASMLLSDLSSSNLSSLDESIPSLGYLET